MTSTELHPITPGQDLTGRVAVVTGASSGIGAATARLLAGRGARVALLARRTDRLSALADELGAPDDVLALPADVTDPEALAAAAREVAARLGRVDLVVANAGLMLAGPWREGRSADAAAMLAVNVEGVWATAEAFRTALLDGGGDLVVVSSIGAHVPFPGYAAYCATKAAVTTWARIVRAELAGSGVRVTVVEPGFTESELGRHLEGEQAAQLAAMRDAVGAMSADDVARAIAFAVAQPPGVVLNQLEVRPATQPV
jgi:NADP-dependent 3-hydroxy acid dehydrogenase YdfG